MSKEPLRVKVQTCVLAHSGGGTGESHYRYVEESTKIINHNNSSDRKWLGSHCFWAMRNGRRVTTTPIH